MIEEIEQLEQIEISVATGWLIGHRTEAVGRE